MPFTHKYQCTDCNEIMDSPLSHDCPNDPMKDPVKRAEFEARQAEYEKHFQAWEDWLDVHCPGHSGTASIREYPNDVAHKGKCILVAYEGGEIAYQSQLLDSPTWGEVMIEFEKSMIATDDYHHCFLEGLTPLSSSKGVTAFEFSTGS